MEVLLADFLGFCYGVKRAIKIARDSTGNGRTVTLGPIIHNPQMVARLAGEGVGSVDSVDDVSDGTLIIRSHGVGPEVYDAAKEKGLRLVDATCPHVRKAQLSAEELAREGRTVVIIGEERHPEVQSIYEWSRHSAQIIGSVEEASAVSNCQKLGIVSQTTFSANRFKEIVGVLLDKSRDIRIMRTICDATEQRQRAATALAKQVDLMLVIGGKNSANTTRLYRLCAEKCPTRHIETADELKDEWFYGAKKIGITAGASTPDWIIKEVYKQCQMKETN